MRQITSITLWLATSLLFFLSLEHIIFYAQQQYLFLFDNHYFDKYIHYAGGLSDYISSFLTQFFFYPLLGAAIIGLIFTIIYLTLGSTAKKINGVGDIFELSLFLTLYLLLCNGYPLFVNIITAVMINILFFRLMVIELPRAKHLLAFILIPILYAITGLAFIISAALFVTYIIIGKKRLLEKKYLLGGAVLISAITPYISTFVYPISITSAYNYVDALAMKSYLTFTLLAVSFMLIYRFVKLPKLKWYLRIVVFVIICSSYFIYTAKQTNTPAKDIIIISNDASNDNWEGVLEKVSDIKYKNKFVTYLTNVALFRTGQFNTRLLNYPQPYGIEGLYFQWTQNNVETPVGGYVFENIGNINEANRWSFEQTTMTEESSKTLRKMIDYNTKLGKPKVANKYARILNKSLFHSAPIVNDIHSDTTYIENRQYFTSPAEFEKNLQMMLLIDSTNTGAFDYLMATYLLSNRVQEFGRNVAPAIKRYNGKLPPMYEEALLIYKQVNPDGFAKIGYEISNETMGKFTEFEKIIKSNNGKSGTVRNYGKTYWYYLLYLSPYGNQVL